jgi:hypothetical protein
MGRELSYLGETNDGHMAHESFTDPNDPGGKPDGSALPQSVSEHRLAYFQERIVDHEGGPKHALIQEPVDGVVRESGQWGGGWIVARSLEGDYGQVLCEAAFLLGQGRVSGE